MPDSTRDQIDFLRGISLDVRSKARSIGVDELHDMLVKHSGKYPSNRTMARALAKMKRAAAARDRAAASDALERAAEVAQSGRFIMTDQWAFWHIAQLASKVF